MPMRSDGQRVRSPAPPAPNIRASGSLNWQRGHDD